MLNTILVAIAVDNPTATDQILQTLHEFQLQPTTQVILCHVIAQVDLTGELIADKPHATSDEFAYRNLEKQLQAYQEKLPCRAELELVTGDPAEEIVRLAHIHQADLILIGNRGLTGLDRIIQGSVSSQVVETANCSVLVVKPKS